MIRTEMILKIIIDTIADLTGVDKSTLTPDTVLADIGVDELTTAQLFIAIEEEFNVEIPDSEELKAGTIQDAVALVAVVERYSGVRDLA